MSKFKKVMHMLLCMCI